MKKSKMIICLLSMAIVLSSCKTAPADLGTEEQEPTYQESETDTLHETDTGSEKEAAAEYVPSKEEVLAMRESALEGMSGEEIDRLTENIKVANLQMESAYLYEDIFKELSDKDSVYWQYFDKKGDIQLGWWYKGRICSMDMIMRAEGITEEEFYDTYEEPGIVYNRFDASNFITLIEDMKTSVQDEKLAADLQQLIDLTYLAAGTHEVTYANDIYKILHDLDYFLLRYGIEDVGKYTEDNSVTAKYYGVLAVYGAEPFEAENKD